MFSKWFQLKWLKVVSDNSFFLSALHKQIIYPHDILLFLIWSFILIWDCFCIFFSKAYFHCQFFILLNSLFRNFKIFLQIFRKQEIIYFFYSLTLQNIIQKIYALYNNIRSNLWSLNRNWLQNIYCQNWPSG